LITPAARALAQELSGLAGAVWDVATPQTSYAWTLDYAQGMGAHAHLVASWLNEGHVEGHHRDGYTFQVGTRTTVLSPRLSLGLSGGAYRFFDTVDEPVRGYSNHHGWGAILSGRVSYSFANRVMLRGGVNRVWTSRTSTDSWTTLLGMGYQLQAPEEPAYRERSAGPAPRPGRNEITALVGRTVVNSFRNERSVAVALEYRRRIADYIDWSVAVIDEGDPNVIRRSGVVTQLWAVRSFFDDRMTLGMGAGVYVAVDAKREPGPDVQGGGTVAELVTPTVGWRVARAFLLRFNWERTITSYDRDTDIFLIGVGYLF
jgi:hypothetical protein